MRSTRETGSFGSIVAAAARRRGAARAPVVVGVVALVTLFALVQRWADRRGVRAETEAATRAYFAGALALELGITDEARPYLERVTALAPREPGGWLNLALLRFRSGDIDGAEAALERATGPGHLPERLVARALILRERGDGEAAAVFLAAAAARAQAEGRLRTEARIRYALAQQREQLGDLRGAALPLQRLATLRPTSVFVPLAQLRVAASTGDLAAANSSWFALEPFVGGRAEAPRPAQDAWRRVGAAITAADVDALRRESLRLETALQRMGAYQREADDLDAIARRRGLAAGVPATLPTARGASPVDLALRLEAVEGGPGTSLIAVYGDPAEPPELVAGDRIDLGHPAPADRREEDHGDVGDDGHDGHEHGAEVATPLDAGPTFAASEQAVASIDWSQDLEVDLVVGGARGIRFLLRPPGRALTDVTGQMRLPRERVERPVRAIAPIDLEGDGDLDLIVLPVTGAPWLATNRGDLAFAASEPFGDERAVDVALTDFDEDGLLDVAFLLGDGRLRVWHNARGGQVSAVSAGSVPGLLAITEHADLAGLWALDRAGRPVVVRARKDSRGTLSLAPTVGGDRFGELPAPSPGAPLRLLTGDLDRNGALDIVAVGAARSLALLAGGEGEAAFPVRIPIDGRVTDVADVDGDGWLELLGARGGRAMRWSARGTRGYGYQRIRPRAKALTGDGRINSYGVGSDLSARAGLLLVRRRVTKPVVHLGTGDRGPVDALRCVWPNGTQSARFGLAPDSEVLCEQWLKGSCPFLFTWNGERWSFTTDLLWRSPLGLRLNAQDTAGVAQTLDRVRIPPGVMVPRDGRYELRVTADLWETHFFDHVRLFAIDHPGVRPVSLDERFAIPPPDLEPFALRTAARPVVRAWDQASRDVTHTVAFRDANYLAGFALGRYQGVAREHWVALELPPEALQGAGDLVILAEGFVHPTDSSLNLAIAQGLQPSAPSGLALDVERGFGHWQEVTAGLGFPAGKHKTVRIDLRAALAHARPGEPLRVRLRTNLEIYWDQIRWARVDPLGAAGLAMAPVRMTSASLRFRGLSVMERARLENPELPRYEDPDTEPAARWRDLRGYVTRFGPIDELLAGAPDDRYAILTAGDEMVLTFEVPPPPPAGYARTFILESSGWVKDGDYSTGFSETVRPLPLHEDRAYRGPRRPLEENTAWRRHREDWQAFHTRFTSAARFRRFLEPESERVGHDALGPRGD